MIRRERRGQHEQGALHFPHHGVKTALLVTLNRSERPHPNVPSQKFTIIRNRGAWASGPSITRSQNLVGQNNGPEAHATTQELAYVFVSQYTECL